ncbi:MAG TPA: SUMF1/EgtB/PvdO family nonheme iron enzyme [Bacteroidales bacterium]|nr:SUMF1/EgtB/PvdO family nonheme iron enzyme [Bacteroidales bacterium]HPS16968.1 SUMF1/EgtB/PvdO family nonheme iron enzyme [Bacteroidales bacterium]
MNRKTISKLFLAVAILSLAACKKDQSSTTGWEYNQPKNGGFEVVPYEEQETGPGLILVEGGTYAMGRTEQDVLYDWNNIPRRVTVSSFYMDETEIRNLDWLEYLYWLTRVYGVDFPEVYKKALPDTLVWRDKLAYNEPFVEYYLRHPAYRDYPVVGVSWLQASNYCAWRTDRVNEYILIREGILKTNPDQSNEDNFNTEAYLAGQYEGLVKNDLIDLNPSGQGTRKVRMEDGILLPKYRLPTEAEWEFASLGLIGNTLFERVIERRLYPWNGHIIRTDMDKNLGDFVTNFKRGRGDNMGVAGNLNDAADIPGPVISYWPNDYGLYNMAGNVAEWVMDVYRPLSPEDMSDFNPYRGNVFKTKVTDEEGNIAEKDTLGNIMWRNVTIQESAGRRNYRKSDNINYLDGDWTSAIDHDWLAREDDSLSTSNLMYDYSNTSMINDKSRVYKGGSWNDRAYFLVAGTRRFLDESLSTSYIGFRCAMTRVGSPIGGN